MVSSSVAIEIVWAKLESFTKASPQREGKIKGTLPRSRLFTKALKRKNGKLGQTNFIYISSAKKLHIWWGRRDSIHEGELWKE